MHSNFFLIHYINCKNRSVDWSVPQETAAGIRSLEKQVVVAKSGSWEKLIKDESWSRISTHTCFHSHVKCRGIDSKKARTLSGKRSTFNFVLVFQYIPADPMLWLVRIYSNQEKPNVWVQTDWLWSYIS